MPLDGMCSSSGPTDRLNRLADFVLKTKPNNGLTKTPTIGSGNVSGSLLLSRDRLKVGGIVTLRNCRHGNSYLLFRSRRGDDFTPRQHCRCPEGLRILRSIVAP